MNAKTTDESRLVDAARRGDLGSFSALVTLYHARAVRVATAFVGNAEDGRDLAQDAFVKAFEGLASFRGESRFYTWYYRILANVCRDFLRRRRPGVLGWFGGEDDDPAERIPSGAPDAAAALDGKETMSAITAALRQLPYRQRTVFALRYFDGLALEEIASALDLTTGAVKAHLWQAGQKMQTLLKDYRPIGKEVANG